MGGLQWRVGEHDVLYGLWEVSDVWIMGMLSLLMSRKCNGEVGAEIIKFSASLLTALLNVCLLFQI